MPDLAPQRFRYSPVNEPFANIMGSAFEDNHSAFISAFRAEINDPVCGPDNIQIMLYKYHRAACFNESVEDIEKRLHIGKMQSHCRFIENIKK